MGKLDVFDIKSEFPGKDSLQYANNFSSPNQRTSPTTSDGVLRCNYCSKVFKRMSNLTLHIAAHEGRYQYQCLICHKRFVRKNHFDGHVRTHDLSRPFACEFCGKTYKERKHHKEHLRRAHRYDHNAPFNDDNCAKSNEPSAVHMPIDLST